MNGIDNRPTIDLRSLPKGALHPHIGAAESALHDIVFPKGGDGPIVEEIVCTCTSSLGPHLSTDLRTLSWAITRDLVKMWAGHGRELNINYKLCYTESKMLALLRYANRVTKNSPHIRKGAIQLYSGIMRYCSVLPGPRIFLNGPGKSGTHLLSDCLTLMPRVMFSGRHFTLEDFCADQQTKTPDFYPPYEQPARLEIVKLRSYLGASQKGMFVTAHAPHHTALERILSDFGYKQVLLFRDPRDLIVSYVHFVLNDKRHHHNEYFRRALSTMEERINAVIEGIPAGAFPEHPRPGIRQLYDGFLPWLEIADTEMVRYEDLIGTSAGGCEDVQRRALRRIADCIDRHPDDERLNDIAKRMYSSKSLTFRKGGSGDWRTHFSPDNVKQFKSFSTDLLIELGYETSDDWGT